MDINIEKIINNKLDSGKVNIKIEIKDENNYVDKFIEYIKNFKNTKIVITDTNELITIETKDILYFYSDKKYNYCKTEENDFKIKSKLYELERINKDFLRISKSCVINIQNVKCFDFGETGKIIVKFNNDFEQIVSRRKIKDVMNYLDGRRI